MTEEPGKRQTLSKGTVDHPNPKLGQLHETTELMTIPNVGHVARTTVFKTDWSIVSVALAALK